MSQHPSTFAGEPARDESVFGGIGWNDSATLNRTADGGGILHGAKAIRSGTLAELVRFFTMLPLADRANYMIEKAGDRQYHQHEIMALAGRKDFPAAPAG